MSSPNWPVQVAVLAKLRGDATLTALLAGGGGVLDAVPQGTRYPYLALGTFSPMPADTMTRTGRDVMFYVHGWSRYAGKMEAEAIMSRVDELLDRWQPVVAGWESVKVLNDYGPEVIDDPDGVRRHGVARYRVHVQES